MKIEFVCRFQKSIQPYVSGAVQPRVSQQISGHLVNFEVGRETHSQLLLERYSHVILSNGLMILCILAYSQRFREACTKLNPWEWSSVSHRLGANISSLEYFAKVRGLQWVRLLTCDAGVATWAIQNPEFVQQTLDVGRDHPHSWIIPGSGNMLMRATFRGQAQIPVERNIYSALTFSLHPKPSNWPVKWPYPTDPTTRRPFTKCRLCYSSNNIKCDCDPTTHPLVLRPLVELQLYGAKGVGVRALQYIKEHDILDEHVGELIPSTAPRDDEFGCHLDVEPRKNRAPQVVAQISSKVYGNWTRYINHSCNASTLFELAVIGDKLRVLVVATRDIDIFEEITLDYGDGYFDKVAGLVCRCEEKTCRYVSCSG